MRFLALHVDRFRCEITEQGRSPIVEEYDDPVTVVEEALLILASVEKQDEPSPKGVAERTAQEISKLAKNLKVKGVVLHPFAHLFAELGSPKIAIDVLKQTEEILRGGGFSVYRTPFGWFNSLEIKAKGHPLSRVARSISEGTKPNK